MLHPIYSNHGDWNDVYIEIFSYETTTMSTIYILSIPWANNLYLFWLFFFCSITAIKAIYNLIELFLKIIYGDFETDH